MRAAYYDGYGDRGCERTSSKMDVRFSDGMAFARMLSEKIATTLRNREMIPDASLEDEKSIQKRSRKTEKLPGRNTRRRCSRKREESYRVMEAAKYEAVPKDRREFIQKPIWQETHAGIQTSLRKPEPVSEQTEVQPIAPAAPPESKEDDFFVEAAPLEPRDETSSEPVICPETAEVMVKDVQQMNLFEEKLLSVQNRSRYRIIGQVFDTYWLIQFEDKLFIIDQHAAHEKVKYERLMKQFHEKSVVSQRLMPPIIVSLTGQEESVLHTYEDAFTQLGFEIEAFGGNEYALRSVPVDLYGCSERELFLAVLDELSQETGNRGSFQVIEEKIASMSCKAAVKGNNRLSLQEAEQLIDELLTLDNPYNCPLRQTYHHYHDGD